MARLTSTLTMQLVDNVSKPARTVAQALKDAEAKVKAVAKGMADTGASDRLVKSISRLSLSKKDIDQVASAWKDYAKSAGLAANSANWTKSQAAAVKQWETQTVAALRAVKRERQAFSREMSRMKTDPGGFRRGMTGLAGMATGYHAQNFGKKAVVSAAEFDIGVRKQREFTDISKEDQAPLLAQARKIGQDTQFSNLDVVKAQTKAMQGLPTNFTATQRADTARGIIENVKNYALIMEADLEKSSEGLRSYLQNVGKDISTPEKAMFESNKAVNQLVKMAKLGGMDDEDVQQFIKFAGSPGATAGLTPESMMALGAVARRGGLRGDEFGTAMRTASSKLASPTKQGITALQAAGIDHSKYVKMPGKLSVANFEGHASRELGVNMTDAVRARLETIFNDPKLIGNRGAFTAAVTGAMDPLFARNKKGEYSAKDKQAVARAAGGFHKVSAESVDAQRLIDDIMMSNMSLAQLNSFFTDKHGGKFAITQRQREEYVAARKAQLAAGDDPDFAKRKADEIMGGLGGAFERLKGSVDNLNLAFGEANASWLKPAFDKMGNVLDAISNLPEPARQAATALGAVGAAYAGVAGAQALFGGFGLSTSAAALNSSASALTAAAVKLGGGTVPGGALPPAVGGGLKGLPVFTTTAALTGLVAVIAAGAERGDMRGAVMTDDPWLPGMPGAKGSVPLPMPTERNMASARVATEDLDRAKEKAEGARAAVDGLSTTVRPNVDSSGVDALISKIERARAGLAALDSGVAALERRAVNIPSLGRVQRGSFTTGGVSGE